MFLSLNQLHLQRIIISLYEKNSTTNIWMLGVFIVIRGILFLSYFSIHDWEMYLSSLVFRVLGIQLSTTLLPCFETRSHCVALLPECGTKGVPCQFWETFGLELTKSLLDESSLDLLSLYSPAAWRAGQDVYLIPVEWAGVVHDVHRAAVEHVPQASHFVRSDGINCVCESRATKPNLARLQGQLQRSLLKY